MPIVVGVKFRSNAKIYFFTPNDNEFAVNDGVIVETARGIEYGNIIQTAHNVSDSEIVGQLRSVIRKATDEDKQTNDENISKRIDALKQAEEKVKSNNLNMKLIDVEFTFDKSKVIFYFTADGRVDFRELVRDLASIFRTRIELRQVGIRDEAKLLGGLGPCGRECCCSYFLPDFERVSIKMAKVQGLSLNPTKISGLCGRLMCCLKFENDHYCETAKVMPKLGSTVTTPDGEGVVNSLDMLKRKVKVAFIRDNLPVEYKEYKLCQLTFKGNMEIDDSSDDTEELND